MSVFLLLTAIGASFVAGLVVSDWRHDYREVCRHLRRLDREVAHERRLEAEALHRAEVLRHINESARPAPPAPSDAEGSDGRAGGEP